MSNVEMYYLNSTLNFGIVPVLLFQLEVYCKVDRLINGLTSQQKGTTARWHSNKTSLATISLILSAKRSQRQLFKSIEINPIANSGSNLTNELWAY